MARNGSGTYVVYTPGNPVVTGTTISSTAYNSTINDIATALTGSISADGQTPITANIPMNSHKLTGLAAPTVAGDALSYGGVVAGSTGAFTSSALGTQVIATNGGTTTLTSTSPYYTVFTGTFVQTLVLPDATTLTVGQQYGIDNDGSLAITVKTNGGATLWTIASGCDLYLTLTAQATAVGTWETDYQGAQLATGKTLVVNNSVTVNGTDGTTMTLPAVSGTLATLAGSETLTNKALNGTLGATTPSTVVATTITGNSFIPNLSTIPTNGLYLPAANSVGIATNSTNRMTIDASGTVGIGGTPSSWSGIGPVLELPYGSISGYSTGYMYIAQNSYYNTNFNYKTTAAAGMYAQSLGQHQWHTAPSGTAGTAITFTQAMTLHASGGLSINNTVDPGVGALITTSTITTSLSSSSSTTTDGVALKRAGVASGDASPSIIFDVGGGGGGADIYTTRAGGAGGTLYIRTDNTSGVKTTAITIDSSGNVGIGVTPSAWDSIIGAIESYNGNYFASQTNATPNLFLGNNSYYSSAAWRYKNTGFAATQYQQITGKHIWNTSGVGTAGTAITFTQAMTLDVNGNLLVNQTSADTGAKLSVTGGIKGTITSGTAVASTSGTSIDFTGIPSWAKRITVMFNGVSTNGTSNLQIQLGSGSVTTTGYVSTGIATSAGGSSVASSTTGILTEAAGAIANTRYGNIILNLLGSNIWIGSSGNILQTTAQISSGSGYVSLGGAIDRVRITTVNGTDTFDAGSINIMYEG